ncbi:unnamed protein product [Symbiodinium sp. CCMP2592]|nr:unnamed protein product [Symbiodinium sp. CCMP2592]
MATLVDAAVFLQDKQQTFHQTDDGVIDHQENYWNMLFSAHGNLMDVPKMTIQTTCRIVNPAELRSMPVTYRMGNMALDGYHIMCCAGKDHETGMMLRADKDPHHTACALVIVDSQDDPGILPQWRQQAPHCQDRIMPSYRYFAVMAKIVLDMLLKHDECAILTCYRLQKEFVLPLLVTMITDLAKEKELDQFTSRKNLEEKLRVLESGSSGDYSDKLREVTWAVGGENIITDSTKVVLGQTAHHTARASKGFTFKAVVALLTKRARRDEHPLGIAFSSRGVRTVLMTRASYELVVVLDNWIMKQAAETTRKAISHRKADDSGSETPFDRSGRSNWKILEHVWPTFRFRGELARFECASDALGDCEDPQEWKPTSQHWKKTDAPATLHELRRGVELGDAMQKSRFDELVRKFQFFSAATCFKDLPDQEKMQKLFDRISRTGSRVLKEAENPKGKGKGKNRMDKNTRTNEETHAWEAGRAKIRGFVKEIFPPEADDDEADMQPSLRDQCRTMMSYLLDAVHWNLTLDNGQVNNDVKAQRWPHLVSIPFWRVDGLEDACQETLWHEQHILGAAIVDANQEEKLGMRLASHKANKIVTKHASHYWRECRSDRVALRVVLREEAIMHIYHAMGVHRQNSQVRTMVVRMRDLNAVRMLCKALHKLEFCKRFGVFEDRMALWPPDTEAAQLTSDAIIDLCLQGSEQAFQSLLHPNQE